MDVRILRRSQIDCAEWDRFCGRRHASFACLSSNFSRLGINVRFAEIHESGQRVAQGAFHVSPRHVQFRDSLIVEAAHFDRTASCIAAVLDAIGKPDAVVSYGSPWNMQPSIAPQLPDSRFVVLEQQHYFVDAIDLHEFGDADSLFRALNQSQRRHIKKGECSCGALHRHVGWSALRQIPTMLSLHGETFRRKGLVHRSLRNLVSLVKGLWTFGNRAVISLAECEGRFLSGMFSVEHDGSFFYVRGGSVPNRLGISHFQHWTAIRECFRRGQRFYVMGYAYEKDLGCESLAAQRTFKKRFRAGEYAGSIVKFKRAA